MKVVVECVICHQKFESDGSLLVPEHPDQTQTKINCIGSNHNGRLVN